MKRNEKHPTEWRYDFGQGRTVVAWHDHDIVVARLDVDQAAPTLRLRVFDYRVHRDGGGFPGELEPGWLAELEAWANQPGRAVQLLQAQNAELRPDGRVPMRLPARPPQHRGKLPDWFYAEVASFAQICVDNGIAVTPRLAEDNDVPKSTVDRWLREARARGFEVKR